MHLPASYCSNLVMSGFRKLLRSEFSAKPCRSRVLFTRRKLNLNFLTWKGFGVSLCHRLTLSALGSLFLHDVSLTKSWLSSLAGFGTGSVSDGLESQVIDRICFLIHVCKCHLSPSLRWTRWKIAVSLLSWAPMATRGCGPWSESHWARSEPLSSGSSTKLPVAKFTCLHTGMSVKRCVCYWAHHNIYFLMTVVKLNNGTSDMLQACLTLLHLFHLSDFSLSLIIDFF